jgi:hypothetical protein
MAPDCVCGHSGGAHENEMPYPCNDCDCKAFASVLGAFAAKPADRDAAQGREVPDFYAVAVRIIRECSQSLPLMPTAFVQAELAAVFAAGQRSASEAQPALPQPQPGQLGEKLRNMADGIRLESPPFASEMLTLADEADALARERDALSWQLAQVREQLADLLRAQAAAASGEGEQG